MNTDDTDRRKTIDKLLWLCQIIRSYLLRFLRSYVFQGVWVFLIRVYPRKSAVRSWVFQFRRSTYTEDTFPASPGTSAALPASPAQCCADHRPSSRRRTPRDWPEASARALSSIARDKVF